MTIIGQLPPLAIISTKPMGSANIGRADDPSLGNRKKPPKMSDLDGIERTLGLFITDHPSHNTHPLTPRPGTPTADVPALTRCPT